MREVIANVTLVVGAKPNDMWSVDYKYMVGPLLWGWQDHETRQEKLEMCLRSLVDTNPHLTGRDEALALLN